MAPFAIDHVSLLLDEWGADEPRITAAMAHADALHSARHRAVADALWLSGLIEALSGAARPLQASPVIARVA